MACLVGVLVVARAFVERNLDRATRASGGLASHGSSPEVVDSWGGSDWLEIVIVFPRHDYLVFAFKLAARTA